MSNALGEDGNEYMNYDKVYKTVFSPLVTPMGFIKRGPGFFMFDQNQGLLKGFGVDAYNGTDFDLLAGIYSMSINVQESIRGKKRWPDAFISLHTLKNDYPLFVSDYVDDHNANEYRYTNESFARHMELAFRWFMDSIWYKYLVVIKDSETCYRFTKNMKFYFACHYHCEPSLNSNIDLIDNDLEQYYNEHRVSGPVMQYGMPYWPLMTENMAWEAIEVHEYKEALKTARLVLYKETVNELRQKDVSGLWKKLKEDGYYHMGIRQKRQYTADHKDIFDRLDSIHEKYKDYHISPDDISQCSGESIKRMHDVISLLEAGQYSTVQKIVDDRIEHNKKFCERLFNNVRRHGD